MSSGLPIVEDLGFIEILIVLLLIAVLFGGRKLPELARSLGRAKTAFDEGAGEEEDGARDRDRSDPDEAGSPPDNRT